MGNNQLLSSRSVLRHGAVPALTVTVVGCVSDGHCDRGYLLYKDHCYHFETEQVKNWHDAEAHCTKEQGHLVSFVSEEDLNQELELRRQTDVWTGLNDLAVHGMFMWTDEHIVTFTHWAPGEPNNHDGFSEDCVEMLHQVRSRLCARHAFVCEKARPDITPPTKAPTPPPSQGCADGWTALPHFRNCYKVIMTAQQR
uniref:C-type lectin domain-containing protein n=1 Tax=Fundulus heteroclitus TaxID=8078 RepID=A0A3Q2Q8K9_FUNHE